MQKNPMALVLGIFFIPLSIAVYFANRPVPFWTFHIGIFVNAFIFYLYVAVIKSFLKGVLHPNNSGAILARTTIFAVLITCFFVILDNTIRRPEIVTKNTFIDQIWRGSKKNNVYWRTYNTTINGKIVEVSHDKVEYPAHQRDDCVYVDVTFRYFTTTVNDYRYGC